MKFNELLEEIDEQVFGVKFGEVVSFEPGCVIADAAGVCHGILATGTRCANPARHLIDGYPTCDACWATPPDHHLALRAATRKAPKRPDPTASRDWREEK